MDIINWMLRWLTASDNQFQVYLPDEIVERIAWGDAKLFSNIYRTCKFFNVLLKSQLRKARTQVRDRSKLFLYPDNLKYGINVINGYCLQIDEIHASVPIYTMKYEKTNKIIVVIEGNKVWNWTIHKNNWMLSYYKEDGEKGYELCLYHDGSITKDEDGYLCWESYTYMDKGIFHTRTHSKGIWSSIIKEANIKLKRALLLIAEYT